MDSTIEVIPVKRGRGRPSKYSPEEREQKYKESREKWAKSHQEDRTKSTMEYQERARYAYKLLCEVWNENMLEVKSEHHRNLIKNLVENKKIIA